MSSVVTAKDDPAKGKDQVEPGKAKLGKGKGGSSAGGKPPAHSNGKGRLGAPGQLKTPGATAADPGDASGPNPRSENGNEKITYCHVPPGNPDNGHAITTSVNAIDPGHLNHPEDVIPPFEFVKHGETASFAGQDWGPDAQAYVDAGCSTTATSGGASVAPTTPTATTSTNDAEVAGTSVSEAVSEADESVLDAVLPDAGGARFALLALAPALLGVGVHLVTRRRRV